MTITKNSDRQWPMVATVAFDYTMFTSGTAEAAVDVPAGAKVTGGRLIVDTAFDSGTSDVMEVGDGGDVDRYVASVDVQATGLIGTWLTTGYQYTADDTVDIELTSVGTAATAGAGRLEVEYILDERSNETQT